jgi:AraC-like DNA-binding protein
MIDVSQMLLLVILFLFPQIIYGLPIIKTSVNKIDDENLLIQETMRSFQGRSQQSNLNYAQVGSIDPDPVYELGQSILKVMAEEKPYLNVDFSMDDLAKILKVPKHHLYYCFQNILFTKFTTMRTEYRIEYAKKLLAEADFRRVTLDSVGRDAGFASKSAFYNTFKSSVGCSPGEYARLNNNQSDLKYFNQK